VSLGECVYCGSERQCLDHVPPISWIETFDLIKFKKDGGELLLYPSCHQCNKWLGDKPLFNYKERLLFLYDRYMAEVDKIKALWSEEEIAEMSSMFQRMIRAKQLMVRDLIRKHREIECRMLQL
jgi:hypothetical protein